LKPHFKKKISQNVTKYEFNRIFVYEHIRIKLSLLKNYIMKKQISKINLLGVALVCSVIAIVAMSFQDSAKVKSSSLAPVLTDTPPKSTSIHIDIDLKDIDKAMDELDVELKGINWDKISKDIEVSLNSIDMDKIKNEVNRSINSIDWGKIKNDINTSVKDINLDEIKINIRKATDQMKKNLNSEEFKKSMKDLKKIDTEKIKTEIKKAQKEVEMKKEEMRKEIEKAKKESGNDTTTTIDAKAPRLPDDGRLFIMI
jgi:hypothetical protein